MKQKEVISSKTHLYVMSLNVSKFSPLAKKINDTESAVHSFDGFALKILFPSFLFFYFLLNYRTLPIIKANYLLLYVGKAF